MGDGWRLAVGTLTALPVRRHPAVTPASARAALLLAPLAVLPLGVLVAGILALGGLAGLPDLVVAVVAVGALALGTRALHWDGLSDVADGLTASYEPERSLAVMRSGDAGPAGVVAVLVVGGLQAAALTAFVGGWGQAVVAGAAVCLSRCALWVVCVRALPAARPDGLGAPFAGTVPVPVAGLGILLLAVVPGLAVLALARRCTTRLGGITGDVLGASIEISLALLLAGLSWL